MKLQVLNPVAEKVEKKSAAEGPRLPSLEGKIIGLYWNYKPGGDAALGRASELLKARYAGLETKSYDRRRISKDDVRRIAQECAAVIGSTAD
jgi:hypothetical protein